MPYIGRELDSGNYLKLDDISSSFNGSTTTFNLTAGGKAFFPGSAFSILVNLAGVAQEPEVAYQTSNSQITFASAPASGDQFFCLVLGVAHGVSVPGNSTVNGAQLAKPFNYDGFFYLDDANNRVGVGTATPGKPLHVVGEGQFDSVRVLGDLTVDGTTTTLDTVVTEVDRLEVGANNNTVGLAVTQSGSGHAAIFMGGDVGIGTVNPAEALEVYGNGRFKDTDGSHGIELYPDVAGLGYQRIISFNRTSTEYEDLSIGVNDFVVTTGSSNERLRIKSDGKVGIGLTNPLSRLHLSDAVTTTNNILTLQGTSWGDGEKVYTTYKRGSVDLGRVGVEADGAGNAGQMIFEVATGGSPVERLRILSTGNIGINTTVSPSKVTIGAISSPSFIRGAVAIKAVASNANSGDSNLYLEQSGGGAGYYIAIDSNGDLNFHNSGAVNPTVSFADNDNVGIGTDNPQEKLHVNGTSDFIVDTDAAGLRFGSYGEHDIALVTGRSTPSNSTRVYIENGDGEALRITSAGKIGIGTHSPSNFLHVKNYTNASNYITAENTTAGNAGVRLKNSQGDYAIFANDDLIFYDLENDAERLRATAAGRVLIGGQSASEGSNSNLQIREDGLGANVELFRSYSSATTPCRIRFSKSRGSQSSPTIVADNDRLGEIRFAGYDGTNYDSRAAEIRAEVDGTPGENDMPGRLVFSTTPDGASTSTERFDITSSGVKQIKNGNLNIQSTYIDFSGDVSTPSTAAAIYRPADNTLAFSTANTERLRILSNGNITIGTASNPGGKLFFQSSSGSAQCIASGGTNNQDLIIGQSSTERLRITSDGKMGVGTGTPSQILELKTGEPRICLNGTTANSDKGIEFEHNGTRMGHLFHNPTSGEMSLSVGENTGGAHYLTFKSGDGTERMRIASNGRMGLGTAAPVGQFQVHKNSNDTWATDLDGNQQGDIILSNLSNTNNNFNSISFLTRGDTTTMYHAARISTRYPDHAGSNPSGELIFETKEDAGYLKARMLINRDGKIGIGELVPDRQLHVKSGSNSNDGTLRIESANDNIMDMGTDGTGHFLNCVNTDPFRIKFGGTEKYYLSSSGEVKITETRPYIRIICNAPQSNTDPRAVMSFESSGSNNDEDMYRINFWEGNSSGSADHSNASIRYNASTSDGGDGSIRFANESGTRLFFVSRNGNGGIQGTLTQNTSDIRLKENITPIENALEKVSSLSGFTYTWNQEAQDAGLKGDEHDCVQVGVSAQDVQKVQPEAVKPSPVDRKKYITVQYERLVPLLIEAVKELKEKNTALEQRLTDAGL